MEYVIVYPYKRQWRDRRGLLITIYGFSVRLPSEERQEYSQESPSLWRLSEMIVHSAREQILRGAELMSELPETMEVVIEQIHDKSIRTVKARFDAQELIGLEAMLQERKRRLLSENQIARGLE